MKNKKWFVLTLSSSFITLPLITFNVSCNWKNNPSEQNEENSNIPEQYQEAYSKLKEFKNELLNTQKTLFQVLNKPLEENLSKDYQELINPFLKIIPNLIENEKLNNSQSLTSKINDLLQKYPSNNTLQKIIGTKEKPSILNKILTSLVSLSEDAFQQLNANANYFQYDENSNWSIHKLVPLIYEGLEKIESGQIIPISEIENYLKEAYSYIANRIMHPNPKSLKNLEEIEKIKDNEIDKLIKTYNNSSASGHNHSHSSLNMLWEYNWNMHLLNKYLASSNNELNISKLEELVKNENQEIKDFIVILKNIISKWNTFSWSKLTSWEKTLEKQNYFMLMNKRFNLLKNQLIELSKLFKITNTNNIFPKISLADGTEL